MPASSRPSISGNSACLHGHMISRTRPAVSRLVLLFHVLHVMDGSNLRVSGRYPQENSYPERHTLLYFDDGNVVLSAPLDNGKEVFFRVHKSILACHSPVFAGMFGIPQPSPGGGEIYDGVTLIHMPDAASDLEGLLKAFYDPTCVLPTKRLKQR